MNLAITLVALAAQLALADEPLGSIQIGQPLGGVTVGESTRTWSSPLDSTVNLELVGGTFASLLDEVGKQTRTEYMLIQGLGRCRVSAFVRGMTTREFLQLTLEVGGLTYQQSGRSNFFVITRRNGGPACEQASPPPEGSCSSTGGKEISIECKNGSVSSLANVLYKQTDGNFLVWNEAVNQPVTIKLKNSALTKALEKIAKQREIDVKKIGKKDSFLFVTKNRQHASVEMEKSTETSHVGLIWQAPQSVLSRKEAESIAQSYFALHVGCGSFTGISENANAWIVEGKFGFAGEPIKGFFIDKKTGRITSPVGPSYANQIEMRKNAPK